MTGDFLAQARRPVLTGLLADFPQAKFPKPGQVGLAYGPISRPRIIKRSSPSQLGKCR